MRVRPGRVLRVKVRPGTVRKGGEAWDGSQRGQDQPTGDSISELDEYKLLKNFGTRPLTIEDYLNKSS